jgi:hypothetical protein
MFVRLSPAEHVTVICEHPITHAPRTRCYGQSLQPVRVDFTFCQHSDRATWASVCVEIVGHVLINGSVTATMATAQYLTPDPDDPEDPDNQVPLWVQPLMDQVQADLNRRERLA